MLLSSLKNERAEWSHIGVMYVVASQLKTQVIGTATLWSRKKMYDGGVEDENTWAAKGETALPPWNKHSASAEIILHVSKL